MNRSDAWTIEEDNKLSEIVLNHIKNGSTQLKAFEEAGEVLGRTSAACGFRWNSCVRKKYEAAINLAKQQRKQKQKINQKSNENNEVTNLETDTTFNQFENMINTLKLIQKTFNYMKSEIEKLRTELKNKDEEIKKLKNENTQDVVTKEDVQDFIKILKNARELGVLDDIKEKTS